MKFMIRRWSNSAGGPGGVPSYSGGGSSAAAGGPNESIQFNNGGILDGNSNFLIDSANGLINLNGLQQSILSVPITIVDNTSSPAALFSYTASTNANAVIEYSIVRDGDNRTGRLLVANNTTITSESDDFTETGSTNVTLGAEIVGSNVVITYTSASTGFNGTFKYSMRTWS
jgi:hypothetical protein